MNELQATRLEELKLDLQGRGWATLADLDRATPVHGLATPVGIRTTCSA